MSECDRRLLLLDVKVGMSKECSTHLGICNGLSLLLVNKEAFLSSWVFFVDMLIDHVLCFCVSFISGQIGPKKAPQCLERNKYRMPQVTLNSRSENFCTFRD